MIRFLLGRRIAVLLVIHVLFYSISAMAEPDLKSEPTLNHEAKYHLGMGESGYLKNQISAEFLLNEEWSLGAGFAHYRLNDLESIREVSVSPTWKFKPDHSFDFEASFAGGPGSLRSNVFHLGYRYSLNADEKNLLKTDFGIAIERNRIVDTSATADRVGNQNTIILSVDHDLSDEVRFGVSYSKTSEIDFEQGGRFSLIKPKGQRTAAGINGVSTVPSQETTSLYFNWSYTEQQSITPGIRIFKSALYDDRSYSPSLSWNIFLTQRLSLGFEVSSIIESNHDSTYFGGINLGFRF